MLHGTPTVTTLIGAEGMRKELPWNGFVANDFGVFTEKAVELYTDEKIWNNAQQNGVEIINQLYSKDRLENKLLVNINAIFDNLKSHRVHNFTGQMLSHHLLQSTKYLSKWIEAKNR